jgi:PAS domain S-box-containing protein
MTIIEKHRTEYKLIDQVLNELTQVMQKIDTLEVSAEENTTIIEGLRQSEVMYRKVIEHLPQRIYFKDTHLAYVFCNETYAHDLNIRPDEISGKNDYHFFANELAGKIMAEETEILRIGVKRDTEDTYVVSGQALTVCATKTPVRDDHGVIMGLQVVLQNITEDKSRAENHALRLKNLEELLAQREARTDTLKIDLERVTAQRNQLEAEFKGMEESLQKLIAQHVAEREKLKIELQRETTERKDAVELLRKSFTQIQDLMSSVQQVMGPSSREDQ